MAKTKKLPPPVSELKMTSKVNFADKKTTSKIKMDETEYLMSSKTNHERIISALKSTKGTTYKNLEEFRHAYNL